MSEDVATPDPADQFLSVLERDNPEPAHAELAVDRTDAGTVASDGDDSGDDTTGVGRSASATAGDGADADTGAAASRATGAGDVHDDDGGPAPVERARDEGGKFRKLTGKERQKQIQAEIDKATYLRHEEERRLEELRLQRAQLEAETERLRQTPAKSAASAANGKPSPADIGTKYADYETYVEALADWVADQKMTTARQQWEQQQQVQSARTQQEQAFQRLTERNVKAKEKYPNWEQVRDAGTAALVNAGVPEVPPVMVHAFLQSDLSGDILYYLGTHPDEFVRLTLANLRTPVEAAPLMREHLERLVAFSNSGPARTPISSSAKPPIQPLGSAPVTPSVNPDDLPFGREYLRLVEAETRGRR